MKNSLGVAYLTQNLKFIVIKFHRKRFQNSDLLNDFYTFKIWHCIYKTRAQNKLSTSNKFSTSYTDVSNQELLAQNRNPKTENNSDSKIKMESVWDLKKRTPWKLRRRSFSNPRREECRDLVLTK